MGEVTKFPEPHERRDGSNYRQQRRRLLARYAMHAEELIELRDKVIPPESYPPTLEEDLRVVAVSVCEVIVDSLADDSDREPDMIMASRMLDIYKYFHDRKREEIESLIADPPAAYVRRCYETLRSRFPSPGGLSDEALAQMIELMTDIQESAGSQHEAYQAEQHRRILATDHSDPGTS